MSTFDSSKRIVFQSDEGGVCVIIPCDCGLSIEEIASKDVPAGKPYAIVDIEEVPADRTARDQWTIDDILTPKI